MKKRLIIFIPTLLFGLALIALSGRILLSVYRLTETQSVLNRSAWVVDGNITEKVIGSQPEGLLPLTVKTYAIRYTFPIPPNGQIRNGEQIVTRRTFEKLGEQGSPVQVYISQSDTTVTAIDRRLFFASNTVYRLILGIGALYLGVLLPFWSWKIGQILDKENQIVSS